MSRTWRVGGSPLRSAVDRAAPVALRVAAPVVVLATVWWLVDGADALARLSSASPAWIVLALIAANLQIVLSALRWRLTASQLGLGIGAATAVEEYYLAQWINQTVPGGVLGDAARAARLRGAAGLARSAQSVVIERMAGQIALVVVTLAALAVALAVPGGIDWPAPGVRPMLALAGGFGAGWLILRPAVRAVRRRWPGLGRFAAAARRALTAPAVWPRQAALGLAIVVCNLAAFAFCARATGTTLSVEAIFTVVPLILCAMVLPASIAGWGWREGAAAALFPLAGAAAGAGLAASVCFGIVILLAALPGVLWLARPARIGNRA